MKDTITIYCRHDGIPEDLPVAALAREYVDFLWSLDLQGYSRAGGASWVTSWLRRLYGAWDDEHGFELLLREIGVQRGGWHSHHAKNRYEAWLEENPQQAP